MAIPAHIITHNYIDPKTNQKHSKEYIRGRFLGKGGFAHCYEVTSVETKRRYACKIIPKAKLVKKTTRLKLVTEIKIHRMVSDHKNIVRFFKWFEDDMHVYIILEVCKNKSLLELLKKRGKLTESEVRYFMSQILSALRHLQSKSIIHRDLKLGNIFIGSKYTVKMGDFGLATKLDWRSQRRTTLCGTPNYIAPEMLARGQDGHSFEVDIWSFGVIMYTLLVGKPPFETSDLKLTYSRIKHNYYRFPKELYVSDASKSLIRRILKIDPKKRPSLKEIRLDPFFTSVLIPKCLPQTTGHSVPIITEFRESISRSINVSHKSALCELESSRQLSKPQTSRGALLAESQSDSPNGLKSCSPAIERLYAKFTLEKALACCRDGKDGGEAGAAGERNGTSGTKGGHGFAEDKSADLSGRKAAMRGGCEESGEDSWILKLASSGSSMERKRASEKGGSMVGGDAEGDGRRGNKSSEPVEESRRPQKGLSISRLVNNAFACDAIRNSRSSRSSRSRLLSDGVLASFTPPIWVSSWIDYSYKYGLGYILSNGVYGAFFNDCTKMLLHESRQKIEYFEPKECGQLSDNSGEFETRQTIDTFKYGAEHRKKVTLFKYFAEYLDRKGCSKSFEPSPEFDMEKNPINVSRWCKTHSAIAFIFSNNVLQVNFNDGTEMIITPPATLMDAEGGGKLEAGSAIETQSVASFTGKSGQRKSCSLQAALHSSKSSVKRRARHAKEIMLKVFKGKRELFGAITHFN